MKKVTCALLTALVLLLMSPLSRYAGAPSNSQFYFSGSIALGPWWPGYGWYPSYPYYPYYSYYPYYPYYAPAPPVVVQQQPPVYAEPAPSHSSYWYYCEGPKGYYPYIKSCPGGWMKVVPKTTPPQQ